MLQRNIRSHSGASEVAKATGEKKPPDQSGGFFVRLGGTI